MKIYEVVDYSGSTVAVEWSLKAAKAATRTLVISSGPFEIWRSVVTLSPREAFRVAVLGQGAYASEVDLVCTIGGDE